MITRLILGVLLIGVALAVAQRRPPNYSQDQMPHTSFSCRDKIIGGYYADPETDCQMFHVCVKVPGQGIQDYKFLCPNDTSFDQENQICDDWFNIDCEAATLYYSDNFDLYRLGSDFPSSNRLPSNNVNNAVSETDDDFYLQKSDRGENVGSDLLRGSHSSNFYANKNRGREDDDDDDVTKKPTKTKKLLTGRRPIQTTQVPTTAPAETSPASQYQGRTHNNNYSGRVSQFRGHARNQQAASPTEQPTTSPPQPTRQTEVYSRGSQRSYYSPTAPPATVSPLSSQAADFFRATKQHNYYSTTQNYNVQTSAFPQTTRNYYNPRVTTTTAQPTTTVAAETTAANSEKSNLFETAKLFRLNTGGAFNQYDEPKDEFLKTAPSQNLGASAFNSLQNSYNKLYNTSVSPNYNFNNPTVQPTTFSYQAQTFVNPSTQAPNYNAPTTLRPFQNYYTTPKALTSSQNYQQNNYYSPETTVKAAPQYSPTTIRPYQQPFSPSTQTNYQQQYNPTTLRPFFNQQTQKPYQDQQYNGQQNYQAVTVAQAQLTTVFQSKKNTPIQQQTYQQQNYQQPQANQQQFPVQRNPTQFQTTKSYYSPTTVRPTYQPVQTTGKIADTTEQPRPFTQDAVQPQKKEKEQYDYAYYDDGTQAEYDSIEPLEEFKRTNSKN